MENMEWGDHPEMNFLSCERKWLHCAVFNIQRRLSHPNIVRLLAAARTETYFLLATEYIHGAPLDVVIHSDSSIVKVFCRCWYLWRFKITYFLKSNRRSNIEITKVLCPYHVSWKGKTTTSLPWIWLWPWNISMDRKSSIRTLSPPMWW